MRFFPCFPPHNLCATAFSAMTAVKMKQRKRLQLSVSVWLSLQLIQELIS